MSNSLDKFNKNKPNIFSEKEYNNFITLIGDWIDGDLTRKPMLHKLLAKLPGITKTVYRGQLGDTEINPTLYFSTSTNKEEAELFSKTSCCMFKIHLVNAPAFYIGDLFSDIEKEYLVLGGGTFWINKECTQKGFKQISEGTFECWYTVPRKQNIAVPRKQNIDIDDIAVSLEEDPTIKQQCTPGINCIISGGNHKTSYRGLKRTKGSRKTIGKKKQSIKKNKTKKRYT